MLRDHLLLHAIVAAWGFTAILGKGIELPTPVLVAWRTGLAIVGVLCLRLGLKRKLWPGGREALVMMAVGACIGLHWHLFFLSGKLGSVSVGLVGVSTCSLWCALLEPVFIPGKRLGMLECGVAALVVAGVVVIAVGEPVSLPSLLAGVASAVVAAVFSYCNGRLILRQEHQVITLYEMAGACVVMSLAGLLGNSARWLPDGREWLLLLVLSQVCTVWAYAAYVELLRRLSVFTISLASNLEPLYGILLAGLVFGEYQKLGAAFWTGSILVLAGVIGYPLLNRRRRFCRGISC
ncbi:MAG: DMT family transporter [Verrucomicrobiales bacterium]|nr:DMT family transporter [Verrucomicrobiales bacterium]